jgi:hypothetical protein
MTERPGSDGPNPNRDLAHEIKRLREAGVQWDGPDGVCARVGIKRAQEGRQILRDPGFGHLIRDRGW